VPHAVARQRDPAVLLALGRALLAAPDPVLHDDLVAVDVDVRPAQPDDLGVAQAAVDPEQGRQVELVPNSAAVSMRASPSSAESTGISFSSTLIRLTFGAALISFHSTATLSIVVSWSQILLTLLTGHGRPILADLLVVGRADLVDRQVTEQRHEIRVMHSAVPRLSRGCGGWR
jgi:hypothetical protein